MNNDPIKIVQNETNERILKPGPAFQTSYDNKYKDWDVFAHDDGRYKQALNTNKHDEKLLKSALAARGAKREERRLRPF